MKISRPVLVIAAIALAGIAACASRPRIPLGTASSVDLNRYSGKWFEIASYPAWFQRRCAGGTTAEYEPNPDGSIRVVNRCHDKNGKAIEVVGRATVVPGSGNAKLKVSFFGPFTGDYYIVALDESNYQWSLVGHPSRKYLWILSRTPEMDAATYERVVAEAVVHGYDPTQLKRTDQSRHL